MDEDKSLPSERCGRRVWVDLARGRAAAVTAATAGAHSRANYVSFGNAHASRRRRRGAGWGSDAAGRTSLSER
jgi:hypothetical protein